MSNYIKKVQISLIILLLISNIGLPNNNLYSSERVPAENIEQFVDVFNRIK